MKSRNHAFDLLCGLCIIRMILLHCMGICGFRNEFWFQKLMAWTFFFMSFFFFKAGYFNKGVSRDTWSYLKDRTKRLLVPYLTWAFIGNAIYFTALYTHPHLFAKQLKAINISHLWADSHAWGNPPVWFLFSFFTSYVLVHIMHRLRIPSWIALSFPFISYWLWTLHNPLPMSLSNVFMGMFFFQLGRWWKTIQCRLPKWSTITISVLFIAAFIYLNRHNHGEYDMSLNKWVQHPWGAGINTVLALVGISGFLLSLPLPRIPVINHIGEHSMVYFVLHYPLIYIYSFTSLIFFHHSIRHHTTDLVILLALIFIVCTLAVPLIERVPWLSGRWGKAIRMHQCTHYY